MPSSAASSYQNATAPQGHHVQEPLVLSDGGSSPQDTTARARPSLASSTYPQGLTSSQEQCIQEFLVSSDGSSYTAPSVGLQSYVSAPELADAATPYLLRFFAAAAPGRAPVICEFADWLTAQLHRAEIMPGVRIVRRGGREAVSMVAARVAAAGR